MKINFKTYILIFLAVFSANGLFVIYQNNHKTVKAFGNLLIELGVPSGSPIFVDNDFKPGHCIRKTISIQNNNSTDAEPAVKLILTSNSDNLASQLNLTILSNQEELYSGILSDQFITLPPLSPSVKTFYEMSICFDPNAGNNYQKTELKFDLEFGENLDLHPTLPPECESLSGLINRTITGSGSKVLIGTNNSELIIGDDNTEKIKGRGGNDCIVAGANTEKIYGNAGNDIIIGNNKDNTIYGSTGQDNIFGLEGKDKLYGGTGSDYLDGGPDYDKLYGQTSSDTCVNGEKLSSCEN